MNGNAELLNFVYQNSQMGVGTINHIVEFVQDEDFRQQLDSQLKEYSAIHAAAKEMLNAHGYDEKGLNSFEKVRTYLMINFRP